MDEGLRRKILDAAQAVGIQGRICLAGGAVRDELLGLGSSPDIDVVVEGDALALARLVDQRVQVYPRFGTALAIVDGQKLEFVSSRRESYDSESRKPFTEPGSLEEDARRRDFTVNALMRDLRSGQLLDLTGSGLADLEAGILRTPQDPERTFSDDPLRMLRAVRFQVRLGFQLAPGLAEAIRSQAHRVRILSAERIRDELTLMLEGRNPEESLRALISLGLLEQFAPELAAMEGVEQGRHHHLDVWGHSLAVVKAASSHRDLTLTLAAMLHDVGKPATRSLDENGDTRFFGHEVVGASMAKRLLDRLRFSQEMGETVAVLVRHHMRLMNMTAISDAACRRLMRDLGEHLERLLQLIEADGKGLKAGAATLDLDMIRRRLHEVASHTPLERLESPLNGEEIMQALGIPPGPEVKRIKRMLLDLVLDGDLDPRDKEQAERIVLASRAVETLDAAD